LERLKSWKVAILLLIDIVFINFSYILAFYFRFTYQIPDGHFQNYLKSAAVITLIYLFFFSIFRLYVSLWTYASIDEFMLSIGGCIAANLVTILYGLFIGPVLPHSVSILAGIFSVILVVGFRMSFRIYRRMLIHLNRMDKKEFKRVMIIGAGAAGTMIVDEMKRHPEMKYLPVALIDDSRFKAGTIIHGVKVVGGRKRIKETAIDKAVNEIIIAIPSTSHNNRKEIIDICRETGCKIKIIPGMDELIQGKVSLKKIRDVQVEDLLGRDQIVLDNEGISEYLYNKTVMVTGGGGSIGSELCRQIAKFKPKELLIFDIYENNAYDLQNELRYSNPELKLKVIIASVRDRKRLEKVFNEFRPEVVFHAAAHKHVPLMEDNPSEAVKNNIFGTVNVAEFADKFGSKRFVLISTDKAVNPTNIMGASKRACEMVVQAMDRISKTEFVAVRFGNVLGSNGSVIPLFKKQIANGGPVTVTHRDITRFFMTIPEAAQLVLQAGAYAEGGEIFVLDMGKPVKIYDLACDLIRLSGFEPDKDIKIEVTGLRPGEKLYEELLMAEEGLGKTKHDKIFVGRPTFSDIEVLKRTFEEMIHIIENGTREELIRKVEELVPTYRREIPRVLDKGSGEVAATAEVSATVATVS
jgi:FlaA1/EpsC-like NDP-sugar epimerase